MKKLMAGILAVGLMAGIAGAQEVLSRNAVGYVKVPVPGQGLNLVSTPFVNFDGSAQTFDDVFGDSVPNGAIVHLWDALSATYTTVSFVEGMGWLDDDFQDVGDTELPRGQGVWFENPTSGDLELYIMGEVPDQSYTKSLIPLVEGLSLVTFSYPVEIDLGDADASLFPSDGDILHVWDPTTQSYEAISYVEGMGWLDDDFQEVSVISQPGKSFWYETGTGKTWTNEIPYTWP